MRQSVRKVESIEDIGRTYETFLELRPHLTNKDAFITQVQAQMREGYFMLALFEGEMASACIGYRFLTNLAWGKFLYIDDLITRKESRGNKLGDLLLKEVIEIARAVGCDQVHLDTGHTRHAAHYVYLKNKFEITSHHMRLTL